MEKISYLKAPFVKDLISSNKSYNYEMHHYGWLVGWLGFMAHTHTHTHTYIYIYIYIYIRFLGRMGERSLIREPSGQEYTTGLNQGE